MLLGFIIGFIVGGLVVGFVMKNNTTKSIAALNTIQAAGTKVETAAETEIKK